MEAVGAGGGDESVEVVRMDWTLVGRQAFWAR